MKRKIYLVLAALIGFPAAIGFLYRVAVMISWLLNSVFGLHPMFAAMVALYTILGVVFLTVSLFWKKIHTAFKGIAHD